MLGGAAGGARSRPPSDLQQGVSRFPLYSLFPTQGGNRPTLHKVTTESLFSTSLSTFGVPTPPPNSPLQLELLNCSQRLLLDKDPNKMEDTKLGKACLPETLCCPGDQRQLLEGISVMQPLTIKTEQAKRSCNTCLTNSPKKIVHADGGCSRTNPVTWLGVAGQNVQVQVKREPQHVHMSELVAVKLEQASPGTKPDQPAPAIPASLNNGSIPVGIAVARQRVGDAGLLAALSQKDAQQRLHDLGPASFCHPDGAAAMTVLCDDRTAPLAWPAPPAPPPAPLWQYPGKRAKNERGGRGGRRGRRGGGGRGRGKDTSKELFPPLHDPQNNIAIPGPSTSRTYDEEHDNVKKSSANTKKALKSLPVAMQRKFTDMKRAKEMERFLLPDAPQRKKSRKLSPVRQECRLQKGTPSTPPSPKLRHWEMRNQQNDEPPDIDLPTTPRHRDRESINWDTPKRNQQNDELPDLLTTPHHHDRESIDYDTPTSTISLDSCVEVPGCSPLRVDWTTGNLKNQMSPSTKKLLKSCLIEKKPKEKGNGTKKSTLPHTSSTSKQSPLLPKKQRLEIRGSAQMSMESMVMGGVGVGGVGSVGGGVSSVGGFQLVREPTSGALLLLPAPPDLPHAVVWGGVPYPSAPLLLPPAPHPSHHLQLLSGDLLASTATLQHTHTHSTRLVTLAPAPPPQSHKQDNRKPIMQPLITPHALIKIEAEPPQEKPPPTFAPEPVQQPMLATHLYYQQDFAEQACRSQATSPAAPPTPPPDAHEAPAHKDASNQTDHIDDDDDSPNHADEDERDVACVGVAHFPEEPQTLDMSILQTSRIDSAEESSSEALSTSAVVGAVEKAIHAIERDEALVDSSSSNASNDLVIDTASTSPVPPAQQTRSMVDVSGLELLSNSIEQFERTTPASMPNLDTAPLTVDTRTTTNIMIKSSPKSPPRTDVEPQRRFEFPPAEPSVSERTKPSLDGLGLLCALAEQRFMEEVESPPAASLATSRPFIKSEPLLSPTDPHLPTEGVIKKDRSRRNSSAERRRKRSRDREDRHRHKMDKMRRYKREKDEVRNNGGELEASLRRVTACPCGALACAHAPAAPVPDAHALVNAMEKDLRERLHELQRQCDEKRAQLNALTPPLPALSTPPTPSTPAPSPDSDRGSSKKRKVGRPRKVSSPDSTETIVAKKPKSKSSLVGYLLAKGKLKGGIVCSRTEPSREDTNRTSKVRPKLKAEPILKVYSEEEESEWGLNRSASSSMESLNEVRQKNREKVDRLVRKHSRDDMPELEFAMRRASASSDSEKERRRAKKRRKSLKSKEREEAKETAAEPVPPPVSKCTLTEDKLDSSPRVLTAMGGLFYAGKLSAVTAPDVYAITLDGERGNKPHILSREETLRDAILEVSPTSVSELASGTRVCAYWSQQYRCLYPGTVAVSSPDPHLDKFVAVEFDDGDSGRIAIEDIRFLEPNYPVVVYENPLFTLGKRRRNTSANSTEDKKPIASTSTDKTTNPETQAMEKAEEEDRRDRKKLKKHRKEKLKRLQSCEDDPNSADYVKKKKKKHKCCEEHCKHRRHHKKHHRKHRKRHHSDSKETSSSGDDQHKKSSSDYMDSNKSNEDSGDSNDRLSTLIAVEKSPDEKMKTVIKKAVLPKNPIVKTAVLDFSNLGKLAAKKEDDPKDNLKDSGIGLEEEPSASTSEVAKKKSKKRTVSATSGGSDVGGGVSKMAAFLPGGALWRWAGAPYRRTARPRHRKLFYRAIQRGEETLSVGEAAVFLSTGRPDRPYIGRLEALWEARGAMAVRVRWFYHPEETQGCLPLLYPGGLFESPHTDENDVQTISHKCEVLPLAQYQERMGDEPARYGSVYDNNDVYYRAGHYDPTQQTLRMEPDIPVSNTG